MTLFDRISTCFEKLKKENRAGLICFLMAGDPDLKTARRILDALPEAGADLIELGMPFSDPMADGPIIQKAGQHAIKNKTTLHDCLAMVASFRKKNTTSPLVLMGYYNPIYSYGVERFLEHAAINGVDGLIIVDVPIEEEAELSQPAQKYGIHLIKLVSPVTPKDRLKKITKRATGFLYYISVIGITGTKSVPPEKIEKMVTTCRSVTSLPIAVGFGIRTPEQAALFAKKADAVIIGSALVDHIAALRGTDPKSNPSIEGVTHFVKKLKYAIDHSRAKP